MPIYNGCGYSLTMQVIGGKWKICIIDALRNGPLRPSELFKAIPEATERVINHQIRELLMYKVIDRTIYAEQPPRSEYFITELGKTVFPLIDSLDDWGDKNREIYGDI
ncbi:transcriptional regulator, HxlR family [Pedobacter hartonius]|uniref:Transcriptional regulator, HxlR family n=2 Tax=Pedobacter hartonius TaxID=425514 RepID=A0A1H4HIS5_9SPHI|nr:transcriptional regulator, HxlR family [Pedobacter hartonius]